MTKISTNKIGFTILSSFILIAPLLTNPAYSFNPFPGASLSPQTSTTESAVRSLTESNLLDDTGIELGDISRDDIELGDNINRNNLVENLLETKRAFALNNPRDENTRENLKELLAGSINNNLLSNKIAGNLEAIEEQGSAGLLASARSIQEKEFSQLEALELATEAAAVISD